MHLSNIFLIILQDPRLYPVIISRGEKHEIHNSNQLAFKQSSYLNLHSYQTGPKVIKLFTYSTQLSIKFIMLINVEMHS